ncbi:two-component flavin-dependent monooxygenase/oxygenase LndZ5 [Streptomyces sp. 2231.1]|uniref:acyl-CoA dehydrogenase family protein n=1 Tax=Streptomyces sp. 2231.1 TaxID=1855347 RepID=UPI000899E90C|nr:acyl-CoA dehydrogenase family protein [Streptomyces sp. 2231.1]SEE30011.1 two-component flavin-dependent monooxygenase/oxygenase LndZ5 [Streptomyces sp. 2231.1]
MVDTTAGPLATAARDIAATAAGLAARMAEQRHIDAGLVTAMREAGFMRHLAPARYGGAGGTLADLLDAVATLGEACPATAWCASLFASTPRFVPCFPEAGQKEFWADGPDTAFVCSVLPFGEAVRDADGDGLRVSGRWPYMSAAEHADWLIVCARTTGAGGSRLTLVAVPASAVRIEDTWDSVGMRATGSDTLVLENVPVPAARYVDRDAVFAGRAADGTSIAPLAAVNGLTFVVPALGAAQGALAELTRHLAGKLAEVTPTPGMPGPGGNLATQEMTLARSAAEIDSARLLLTRIARLADDGGPFTGRTIARNMRDSAFTVELLLSAVNRVFRAAGTGGQAAHGTLERFWHDVNAVATHQAVQFEPAAHHYARALFTAP